MFIEYFLTYGGIHGESREYLNSWGIFDLMKYSWEPLTIVYNDSTKTLPSLAMHTMNYYDRCYEHSTQYNMSIFQARSMLKTRLKGTFIFGGK